MVSDSGLSPAGREAERLYYPPENILPEVRQAEPTGLLAVFVRLEKQKLFKTLCGASGGDSGGLRKPGWLMSRKHVSP